MDLAALGRIFLVALAPFVSGARLLPTPVGAPASTREPGAAPGGPLVAARAKEPRAWDELERGVLRFERFHRLEEIERAFAELARAHPRWFVAGSLGESVAGRALPLLRITDRDAPGPKRGFWIDGAIHGGELASAEPVLRVAEELRRAVALERAPEWLAEVELFLAPVLNPDGREDSIAAPFANGRRNHGGREGVDLNRDYPARWTSAKTRAVEAPQPETAAVMAFWRAHPEIELAASFHTSVDAILFPPVAKDAFDSARFLLVAEHYRDELEFPVFETPAEVRGTTMDWFHVARGAVAWTVEIGTARGPGRASNPLRRASRAEDSPRPYARPIEAELETDLDVLSATHASVLLGLAERLATLESRGAHPVRRP